MIIITKFLSVVKKEFKDNIADNSFLAIYFLVLALTLFSFNLTGRSYNFTSSSLFKEAEAEKAVLLLKSPYTGFITFLEVEELVLPVLSLLALVMSFNQINGELNNGCLKVSLSYPIYRDELFIGKIAGGVLTLSLAMVSVFLLGFAELIYMTGIPLSLDFLTRMSVIILSLILYVSTFFLVGTFFSILFDNPIKSLLASTLFYVFIVEEYFYYSILYSVLYLFLGFTDDRMLHRFELAGYPIPSGSIEFYEKYYHIFTSFNIKHNFMTFFNEIFSVISMKSWTDNEGITYYLVNTIPLNNTLPELIIPYVTQAISIMILFILNYLAFRRKDIV